MLEQLESRCLLSGGPNAPLEYFVSEEGVLTINKALNVQIDDHGGRYDFPTPDGVIVLTDYTTGLGYFIGDDEPTVTAIIVNGSNRDDRFSLSLVTDVKVDVFGKAGNDQFIVGGTGNGDMLLDSGAGNDEFLVSNDAMDRPNISIIGGPGKDTFGFGNTPID